MTKPTILLLLSAGALFLAGFISGHGWENENSSPVDNLTMTKHPRFSLSSQHTGKENSLPAYNWTSAQKDYLSFVKKLKGTLTSEECEKLFDEELELYKVNYRNSILPQIKMSLLLNKWADIAPKQTLQKIRDTGQPRHWAVQVFDVWSSKDPEAAAAFYLEPQNKFIKYNRLVLNRIVSNWAKYDPSKTLDWIQSKGNFSRENKQSLENVVQWQQIMQYPEQIPKMIEKYDDKKLEESAYELGQLWEKSSPGSSEWINKLPEKIRIKAEAGRIMSKTGGDLNALNHQIAQFDEETRNQIVAEMADPVLEENRFDAKERISWLVNNLSVDKWVDLDTKIHDWILDNRKEAEQWIDSLPEGEKKTKLKNIKIHDFDSYLSH